MSNTQPSLPTPQPSDYTQPQFQTSQPYYANPQTYYPPQAPLAPMPQQPRKSGMLKFLVILAAVVLVIAGGAFAAYAFSSHSSDATSAPGVHANMQATLDAASTANASTVEAANANLSAQLTAEAMTPTAIPTEPTPAPSTGLGSTQDSGTWAITINSIKPTVSDNEFEVPKAGNEFILINFTALNTDSGAHDMNPFYFTLRDDSGTSYDFTGLTVAKNPDGTVVGGQKLRGDLSYEIPKSVHSLTLQFDSPDDLDHSQVVQWNLTV